jgi:diaminohydroxyphosphoribosylaminopyrimidine deaminase/5-amino-6-(5-phosphoribosylamino)uracil reductase
MQNHELYMRRCLQLAGLGAGYVAPNPMVGAVLVSEGRIIGEGYHRKYGQAHAEVNCINSVKETDQYLISSSTLYVSLEPCAHYGKTPPCADLVIKNAIPTVVVGCRDPFKQVDGKGIEKLQQAGVEVILGVLEKECSALNKRFFVFNIEKRPYIILKWAQSNNGMIAEADGSPVSISNAFTNKLVHRWRSEEAGIMVGTNTALNDNPQLNTRLWTGNSPVRLVLDLNLRLPTNLKLFDQQQKTVVLNSVEEGENGAVLFYKIEKEQSLVKQILDTCYKLNIQSVLVEGGAKLLQSFIDSGIWDEARVITNTELIVDKGLPAPVLQTQRINFLENQFNDVIHYYSRNITAPTDTTQ